MAISFPTGLDNFTNPSSGNTLDSPSHSLQHSNANDAIEAIEAKLGIGNSPAGSATSGYVLTAGTGGTTTWSPVSGSGGLIPIVPSSVSVGSGSGSANATGFVTFSGSSSVALNGVFSSTYENYRILLNLTSSTTNNVFMKLRTGTTDGATNEFGYVLYQMTTNQTVAFTSVSAGTSNGFLLTVGESAQYSSVRLDMSNPYSSTINTNLNWQSSRSSNSSPYMYSYVASGLDGQLAGKPASRDGLNLVTSTGNITGTIIVYGYKN